MNLQRIAIGFISAVVSVVSSFLPHPPIANIASPHANVLGASTSDGSIQFTVNVPSVFNQDITAPNIVYSLKPGTGISISEGQNPTITNTGIISLAAGDGISVDGNKITNTGIKSLAAGTGISIDGNKITNTYSFTPDYTQSGWTTGTGKVYLSTLTNNVGIGTSTPSTALHVVGASTLAGSVTLGSASTDSITFTGRIANGTSLLPNTDLGSDLGASGKRFNNLWVANINSNSSQSFSGQTTFSYAPTDTTISQASVLINPTTSAANGQLLGLAIAGYQRALIDAEGDMILGYNSATSAPATNNPLMIYGHNGTNVASVDTSGNLLISGNAKIGTTALSGYINIIPGGSNYTGYISWYKGGDCGGACRIAYLGYNSGGSNNLGLNLENSASFNINGGNVGIGTTSPIAPLHVAGAYGGNAAVVIDQLNGGDIFTASASGTPKFVIANNGNVGIGTTSPGATLEVAAAVGNVNPYNLFRITNSSGNNGIPSGLALMSSNSSGPNDRNWGLTTNWSANGTLEFQASSNYSGLPSSTKLTITKDGNVGIGTTNPGAALHVNSSTSPGIIVGSNTLTSTGSIDIGSALFSTDAIGNLSLSTSYGGNARVANYYFGSSVAGRLLAGQTAVSEARTGSIVSSGAGHFYTESSGSTAPDALILGNYQGSGSPGIGSSIHFASNNFNINPRDTALISGIFTTTTQGSERGALTFQTAQPLNAGATQLVEAMRIDGSGNVGIGTTSPGSYLLNVNGTTYFGGTVTTGGAIYVQGNSDMNLGRANLGAVYGRTGNPQWQMVQGIYDGGLLLSGSGTGVTIDAGSSGRVAFYNGGSTERMRIDSSGNVGIGTTTPLTGLDVEKGNGGNAAMIVNNPLAGDIFTASASGTPKFVIANNGNVGIGTTSPATKLDVSSGTISVAGGGAISLGSGKNYGCSACVTDSTLNMYDNANGAMIFNTGYSTSYYAFQHGGVEKMRIDSSGLVGIGTTAPVSKLDLQGAVVGKALMNLNETGDQALLTASASGVTKLSVLHNGLVNAAAGGLATFTKAGTISDTDFTDTAVNGLMGFDSTDGRLYIRNGGVWSYIAKTAGFQIPSDEAYTYNSDTKSFDTTRPLADGDFLMPFVEKHLSDGGLHGLYTSFSSVKGLLFSQEDIKIASLSAQVATLANTPTPTPTVLALTVMNAMEANGAVTFKSTATFMGSATFNALAEFVNTVVFHHSPSFNTDTGGYATIKAGASNVDVTFTEPYQKAPIVTAILASSVKLDWYRVTNVTTKGFTIELSPTQSQDVSFNWIALSVQNPNTYTSNVVVPTPTAASTGTPASLTTPTPSPISSPTASPSATPAPSITPLPSINQTTTPSATPSGG